MILRGVIFLICGLVRSGHGFVTTTAAMKVFLLTLGVCDIFFGFLGSLREEGTVGEIVTFVEKVIPDPVLVFIVRGTVVGVFNHERGFSRI